MATEARVILLPVQDTPSSDAALEWYLKEVWKQGACVFETGFSDFVQILHVVDKSEKFFDELLHTDIRLKCAAINDPAVDFVFDRLAPKLAAANVEHRINVLRCSQAARSVGDVVVTNATRIKASMVVMAMKNKSALAEVLMGSCCSHVVHRCPVPVVVVRNLPSVALATE